MRMSLSRARGIQPVVGFECAGSPPGSTLCIGWIAIEWGCYSRSDDHLADDEGATIFDRNRNSADSTLSPPGSLLSSTPSFHQFRPFVPRATRSARCVISLVGSCASQRSPSDCLRARLCSHPCPTRSAREIRESGTFDCEKM